MLVHVMRLTTWEAFKLRRRWMPWILLAVAVAFTQLGIWLSYGAYHNETLQAFTAGGSNSLSTRAEIDGEVIEVSVSCISLLNEGIPPEVEDLPEEVRTNFIEDLERFREEDCTNTDPLHEIRKAFTIPHSIAGSMVGTAGFAPFLILILAASLIGVEYGWGTLRTVLTRGAGRWQLLAAKLVLIVLACAAAYAVIALTAVAASLLAAVVPPEETAGSVEAGSWSEAAITYLKAVYAATPYAALAVFLAVLTQSSSMGMAISMGYYAVELIGAPLLSLTDWGETVADALVGNNVSEWMESAAVTVEINDASSAAGQGDALQAFLVILAYTVLLGAAAFWIFIRRDVAGAKGE